MSSLAFLANHVLSPCLVFVDAFVGFGNDFLNLFRVFKSYDFPPWKHETNSRRGNNGDMET